MTCLLCDIPSYKNRSTDNYIILTRNELINMISECCEVDINKFDLALNTLKGNYASIYGNNSLVKEVFIGTEIGYKSNLHNCTNWNKLQYKYFPDLFTLNISHKEILESDNLEAKLFISYLAVILEDINIDNRDSLMYNIAFRKSQIENLFDISAYDFNKACKQLGIDYGPVFDTVSSNTYKKGNLFRKDIQVACFFDNGSVLKAKEFLKALDVKINWQNAFITRMWFYNNNNQITKSFYTDIEKFNTKISQSENEFYTEIIKTNCVNQKMNYKLDVSNDSSAFEAEVHYRYNRKKVDCESETVEKYTEFEKEKIEKENIEKYNKVIDKCMVPSSPETPAMGLVNREITERIYKASSINDYHKFCSEIQQIFSDCLKLTKNVNVAFEFKSILINCLNESSNSSKETFLSLLSNIKTVVNFFESMIFNEEFMTFGRLGSITKVMKIELLTQLLTREDRVKNKQSIIDEADINNIINDYSNAYEADIEHFNKEEFLTNTLESLNKYTLTEPQKNKIQEIAISLNAKRMYFEYKTLNEQRAAKLDMYGVLIYVLSIDSYSSFENIVSAVKSHKTRNDFVFHQYTMLVNDPNMNNIILSLTNENIQSRKSDIEIFFDIQLNLDNIHANINMVKSTVKKTEEIIRDRTTKQLVIEAFKDNGLVFGQNIDWNKCTEFVFDIELGIRTLNECINSEIAPSELKDNFKGNNVLDSIKKSSKIITD